jgi:alpha-galactosidase
MEKELEVASMLGVDCIQIDDGWQKGITANSAIVKGGVWEGYYASDPNFWEVNKEKFPRGLETIVQSAKEKNIQFGLWFGPDSSNDFVNWEKDANVLLEFYKTYGIRYFKLDGVKIRNKRCELNFIKLLDKVSRDSDNQIRFNLDITAEVRFGYFYEKQFGTIFVENRYTDWANYYPHATLRNLWQLSEFIPTRKLLFEVLNIQRNKEKYGDDPLSPSQYSMDYVFATTMLANPLMWMEMSNVSLEDRVLVANFTPIYKKHREKLFYAEISPIGMLPDGVSFTGFQVMTGENEGYFLLFRELTTDQTYTYCVNNLNNQELEIEMLYSNNAMVDSTISNQVSPNNELVVTIKHPRTFIFAKYTVKAAL